MYKLLLSLAASLTLAACAVQPASHADLPSTVQSIAPSDWSVDAPQDSADSAAWWQQFGDPVLHELVTSVLNQNLDLQAAFCGGVRVNWLSLPLCFDVRQQPARNSEPTP